LVVAHLGASLPRPFERVLFLIGNLYEHPEIIRAVYQKMSLNEIRRMGRFHGYVCSLVHEWASDSWAHMNVHDHTYRRLFNFRRSRIPTVVHVEIELS
jgi:peptidoglycan/xylan/chitin deacetylase (PgdA/CDA1 family)